MALASSLGDLIRSQRLLEEQKRLRVGFVNRCSIFVWSSSHDLLLIATDAAPGGLDHFSRSAAWPYPTPKSRFGSTAQYPSQIMWEFNE